MSGQLHAPAAFTANESPPITHWIGDRVGPRAGLDIVEMRKKKKILSPAAIQVVAFCYTDGTLPAP
jgi:hypothetical protein